jgi:hypothetical protein
MNGLEILMNTLIKALGIDPAQVIKHVDDMRLIAVSIKGQLDQIAADQQVIKSELRDIRERLDKLEQDNERELSAGTSGDRGKGHAIDSWLGDIDAGDDA